MQRPRPGLAVLAQVKGPEIGESGIYARHRTRMRCAPDRVKASRSPAVLPAVGADPLLDHRRDLLAPLTAVEDAVMADAPRHQIALLPGRQRLGQRQRRLGLADPRNIVALALDREPADVRSEAQTSELQS